MTDEALGGPVAAARTVTFLFTDIENSTRLWEAHDARPDAMRTALARHDALVRKAIEGHGGRVFKTMGDEFCAAFDDAPGAVRAARTAQATLAAEPWPETAPLRVRVALHTGTVHERDDDYFGASLSRVARLRAAAHGGQTLLSQATRDLVADSLSDGVTLRDLGQHRLKDLQRPERIYQLDHDDLPADFPPLRSLEAFAHNLPIQLSSFIGREREIAELKRLLSDPARSARLLTITGPGGGGKTRLALQVAADVLHRYPDGVFLAELETVTNAERVVFVVAQTLGVREEAGERTLAETLAGRLRHRRLLLLLDNCEQVIEACARLCDTLLRACPDLQIVATTREELGIEGEYAWHVPPLGLPEPGRKNDAASDSVARSESVRLFVERAQAAQPDFTLSDKSSSAPLVAELCRRLDGIPFAIELAAARTRVLSVEQIAARLNDRFRLLTGGSRAALPRHQTLRATLDWSYDLLTGEEQTLLRRLSVFRGGWTLEAAEAVCADRNAGTGGIAPDAVVFLLDHLALKSLVAAGSEPGGAAAARRHNLLESVRHYGQDRLIERGEIAAARDRHRDWCLEFAEAAEPALQGPNQVACLDHLEAEHDNLRAALEWAAPEPQTRLRLAGALHRFWFVRGHLREGRAWLEGGLSEPNETVPDAVREKALNGAGILALQQGAFGEARGFHEAGLVLARARGDQKSIARALNNLGIVARHQGDPARAADCYAQSLAIYRALGDAMRVAMSLSNLGGVACDRNDPAGAIPLYRESLACYQDLSHPLGVAYVAHNLAGALRSERSPEEARRYYELSLTAQRGLRDRDLVVRTLSGLARVALDQERFDESVRLFGAAERAAAERDAEESPASAAAAACDEDEQDGAISTLRARMGRARFDALFAAGRALTPNAAIQSIVGGDPAV